MKEQAYPHETIILYRELRNLPLCGPLFRGDAYEDGGAEFYEALSQKALAEGWQGDIFLLALADALLSADNALSRSAALGEEQELNPALRRIALAELSWLQNAAQAPLPGMADWRELAANFPALSPYQGSPHYLRPLQALAQILPQAAPEEILQYLLDFHKCFGCGKLARHSFLEWQGGLLGVNNPDPILPGQLFAYEAQKQQVLTHIAAFVAGKPAGNLLLYGERGTGKSSLIKAAANQYGASGLRLLHLPRPAWGELREVLKELSSYSQKFIIFLDDFSFDPTDEIYKQIKTVLEGGAAAMPRNVLCAATSNRRHVVAESWRDREDKQQDMYVADTTAEKLALADRFGLTITFPPPDQDKYLQIVAALAREAGLDMPQEQLFAGAIRWERWYNARSGRTARQYIEHLQAGNWGKEGK